MSVRQEWDSMSVEDKLNWLREFITSVAETENHNIYSRKTQMDDLRKRLGALEAAEAARAGFPNENPIPPPR